MTLTSISLLSFFMVRSLLSRLLCSTFPEGSSAPYLMSADISLHSTQKNLECQLSVVSRGVELFQPEPRDDRIHIEDFGQEVNRLIAAGLRKEPPSERAPLL